jgi:hypothetical protein
MHIRIPFALVSWPATTTSPLMMYISEHLFGKQAESASFAKTI